MMTRDQHVVLIRVLQNREIDQLDANFPVSDCYDDDLARD